MSKGQAEELIFKILARAADPPIAELATEMGYLPLALAQAASHIQQMNISIEKYLERFREAKERYLSRQILPAGDSHVSVWSTVQLAYESLLEESSDASFLLEACSNLAPDAIPSYLLEKMFENEDDFLDAQTLLKNHSLIQVDKETLSIHRLEQKVLRELCHDRKKVLIKLVTVFNEVDLHKKDLHEIRAIFGHGETLLSHCKELPLNTGEMLPLIKTLGNAASKLGVFHKEKDYFDEALNIINELYSSNLEIISEIREKQAIAERHFERYKEAIEIFNEVLNNYDQLKFGPDHEKRAITLQHLGEAEIQISLYTDAKTHLDQALPTIRRVYDNGHEVIATLLKNLGNVENALGNPKVAKDYLVEALEIRKKLKISNSNAGTLLILGNVERALGHFTEAKNKLTQALNLIKEFYGPKHIYFVSACLNLGNVEKDLENFEEAKKLYKEVCDIYKYLNYKSDHFKMAIVYQNLGDVERSLECYTESRNLLEQALNISRTTYGERHIKVADILQDFGNLERDQGNFVDAEMKLEKALEIKKQYYHENSNHVEIARVLEDMGDLKEKQNYIEEAQIHYKTVYPIYRENYGEDHPFTLKVQKKISDLIPAQTA